MLTTDILNLATRIIIVDLTNSDLFYIFNNSTSFITENVGTLLCIHTGPVQIVHRRGLTSWVERNQITAGMPIVVTTGTHWKMASLWCVILVLIITCIIVYQGNCSLFVAVLCAFS